MDRASFSVRPLTLADAATIAGIEARCFERPAERFDFQKVSSLLRNRRTYAIGCENADRTIVGWAAGFARTHRSPRWGRIYALAVDPAHQGHGIGRRLTTDLIAALRRAGADDIYLEVRPDNANAICLYRQCGFADCRFLPDFYAPGVPGQRMVLRT